MNMSTKTKLNVNDGDAEKSFDEDVTERISQQNKLMVRPLTVKKVSFVMSMIRMTKMMMMMITITMVMIMMTLQATAMLMPVMTKNGEGREDELEYYDFMMLMLIADGRCWHWPWFLRCWCCCW